jgi:hypothetical protein
MVLFRSILRCLIKCLRVWLRALNQRVRGRSSWSSSGRASRLGRHSYMPTVAAICLGSGGASLSTGGGVRIISGRERAARPRFLCRSSLVAANCMMGATVSATSHASRADVPAVLARCRPLGARRYSRRRRRCSALTARGEAFERAQLDSTRSWARSGGRRHGLTGIAEPRTRWRPRRHGYAAHPSLRAVTGPCRGVTAQARGARVWGPRRAVECRSRRQIHGRVEDNGPFKQRRCTTVQRGGDPTRARPAPGPSLSLRTAKPRTVSRSGCATRRPRPGATRRPAPSRRRGPGPSRSAPPSTPPAPPP